MRVLITGGLGFIGTNLAIKCLSLGWEVVTVDCGYSFHHKTRMYAINDAANKYQIDCEFVNDYVCRFSQSSDFDNFDVVFHLAANPSVSYSVENPYDSFRNNVQETVVALLAAASTRNIKKIVFASSAAVYGNTNVFPTTENSEKKPESPYGLQKLIGEQLLELYSRTSPVDTVSLRYFNVYGPYQYSTGAYATAVSAWLNAIKDGKPLRKDGTGEQTRDMVFVDDVVNANILAATCSNRLNGVALNIGSGTETSNNRTLNLLGQRFSLKVDAAPFRPGDVMRSFANIDLAKDTVGYTPGVSFEEGLGRTVDFLGL